VREQLKLLEELQRRDAGIAELEVELKTSPQKLGQLQEDVDRIQAVLDREKVQLTETERYKSEQESQLKHEEAQLAKAKQKAQQVKNQKEFLSLQREVDSTRQLAGERMEEVLKLGDAVEAFRKKIEQHSADVTTLRASFAAEEAAGRGRMGELEGQIVKLRKARDEAAGRVRADLLKKYSTIRMKKGLAVVAVHAGTCTGCNMTIPPQLYITLQKNLGTLELCPSCHRIIYWDKLMEEAKLEAGERA
jgi:predicted  nucleic acid-binding Zn-ribbon protein